MEQEQEGKISFNLIVSLIIVFLCVMYYYFSRGYVSNLKDFVMVGDTMMAPISAGTFSKITSALSIAYGLGQPIGGYLLDKVGIKYLSPILLLGAAIGTYAFSNYIDPSVAVYLRYFIGACFCISSTGANKYVCTLWSKYFTILVNLLPISMCLSAAFASSGIVRNLMESIGWRNFLKMYSGIGIVLAISLFVSFSLVLKNNNNKVNQDIPSENTNVSALTGFKELLFLPGFIYVGLFSVAISSAAYTLMEGWGNTLLGLKFANLSPTDLTLPASINMIGNAVGYAYNIWADRFAIKKQMLVYGVIGIISLGSIVFLNLCFTGFLICCFFLGFTCAAQNIGFVFLQRNLPNRYLGFGFGILNFMCMFFGCALVQKIAGILLDMLKNNSIKAGMAFYDGYKYMDLINMFKFLFIPTIIAFVATILFKEKK